MKHEARAWKYRLEKEHSYTLPWMPPHIVLALEWLLIVNQRATVPPDYRWDGCSPSGPYWDTWDGVIDPSTDKPMLYYISLRHDVGYQYIYEIAEALGLSVWKVRAKLDDDFLRDAKTVKFSHAKTYYRFIRAFGWWVVWRRGRKRKAKRKAVGK